MATDPVLKQAYRMSAIIGAASMASLLAYAAVVEWIRIEHAPFSGFAPQSMEGMRDIFFGLALVQFMLIWKIRAAILKRGESDTLQSLAGKLKAAAIVSLSLCEVPAVLGLVLFLTAGLHEEFYIFLAFSFLMMFLHFPRYDHWEAWIRKPSRLY